MNTRTITEMNNEELAKVFHANEQLRQDVMDDMAESEMFWIGEQLDMIKANLTDWSIGQCNRNQHITVRNADDFIYDFANLQKSMAPLRDADEYMVNEAVALVDRYRDTSMDTDEFDELEEQVEEAAKDLADMLCDVYTKTLDEYCLDDKNALDYFIEFYAEERLDGTEYVTGDSWELFEDVSYTKSYGKAV